MSRVSVYAQVAERSIAMDCKSIDLWSTKVRILPCALLRFHCVQATQCQHNCEQSCEALAEQDKFCYTSFVSHYVYILKCSDDSFYVGSTSSVKKRLANHKRGNVKTTRNRRPVSLMWFCCFPNKRKAVIFEKYLKQGSGFAFTRKHLI